MIIVIQNDDGEELTQMRIHPPAGVVTSEIKKWEEETAIGIQAELECSYDVEEV
jgi:hypothetical protein